MIALEVTVALDRTSTPSRGRVLPMNWFRKASSSPQRVPKLGVSLLESTLMEAILPSASITTVTATSDWKPFAEAVFSSPSTAGAASSAAGAREFRASMIALEVTVALDRTSTPSRGRVLPMNWFRNASSSPQRVPKLGVSLLESTLMEAILPSVSITTVTATSDWKPFAEAVFSSPSTAGASSSAGATNSPVATAPFSTVRFTFTSPV